MIVTVPPALSIPSILPVALAYHRISRRCVASGTWVTPRQLARHLDTLRDHGHRIVAPTSPASVPARVGDVLLTFDDGTVDLWQHADVLASRGHAGIVFVPANLLGRPNGWEWRLPGRATRHLTRGELRELAASGWEIGLHGARHRSLTRLSAAALAVELSGGRQRLEEAVGRPVTALAYPYGRTDARVAAAAVAAGLRVGFVLTSAPIGVPAPLARRRRPVYRIDGPRDILSKVTDPDGRTWRGRWQVWKERTAHGVGRWTERCQSSPGAGAGDS